MYTPTTSPTQDPPEDLYKALTISRLENKQLQKHIRSLEEEVHHSALSIASLQKTIAAKELIEDQLRTMLQEAEGNTENAAQDTAQLKELQRECKEKDETIEITEKRLYHEMECSQKIRKDLETTVACLQNTIGALEENVLMLERELQVQSQNYTNEIEKLRMEKMNVSIRLQEALEEAESAKEECRIMKENELSLVAKNEELLDSQRLLQKKLVQATTDAEDRSSESAEVLQYIAKQKKDIEVLRKDNADVNRRLTLARNELKVAEVRYEKLERAFAESIRKVMSDNTLSG
eukprot:CAMPEP_0185022872 /NCGR_PEP_ID=MMETSP1103-20130426/5572_1 /TAXON_ID=36769 /ORGANISM="Paraphysomonas bandaiensis, Strain Caron Lab Isolate" /LENGTH=291 /DNA_ID=CAMNT_0027555145 /DNA_START=45 /DNA_END=920 /DNA_ORIENTATION=+